MVGITNQVCAGPLQFTFLFVCLSVCLSVCPSVQGLGRPGNESTVWQLAHVVGLSELVCSPPRRKSTEQS